MTSKIRAGILTVSDRCFRKEAEDKSGHVLESLLASGSILNIHIVTRSCVPDEHHMIEKTLKCWSDDLSLDLILTTGGTGFSLRDVTPEATKAVLDREAPGMSMAMIESSLKITPMAMLSRLMCGIRKNTIIINFPGSPKACKECLEVVIPVIPHAVHQLRGEVAQVNTIHSAMQVTTTGGDCGCHDKSQADVSAVAHRPRQSPYPLLTVDQAQTIILQEASVMGVEHVDLLESLGRILAEDVIATFPHPPFPASIMDGYAVIAADGSGERVIQGQMTAGDNLTSANVISGSCARISTGAPVPPGADAVVKVEDTELVEAADDGKTEVVVRILSSPRVGQDIRPKGCDIQVGQKVVGRDVHLGPAELGLLASLGRTSICVYRVPKVTVLSTGNELATPGQPLTEGHIYDSNKSSLLAILKQHGFPAVDVGIALDKPEAVREKLKMALENGDVVITTGGVSMGEKDVVKQVLMADFNAEVHFGRVQMKPGKPTTFATASYNEQKKLIFALPGNPVSCMVTSYLFVLPALRKMAGFSKPLFGTLKVRLAADTKLDPRPEYHRVVLQTRSGDAVPWADSTGNQLSSRLLSLHCANALLMLPAQKENLTHIAAGSLVDAMIIGQI